jgi:hypothetical protein
LPSRARNCAKTPFAQINEVLLSDFVRNPRVRVRVIVELRDKPKLLTGYAARICYVGVILTRSRGGYLSAAASLVVFGMFNLDILRAAGSTLLVRIRGPVLIAGVLALTVVFFAGP